VPGGPHNGSVTRPPARVANGGPATARSLGFSLSAAPSPAADEDSRGGRRDRIADLRRAALLPRPPGGTGPDPRAGPDPGRPDRRPGPGGLLRRAPPSHPAAHRGTARGVRARAARSAPAPGAGPARHEPDGAGAARRARRDHRAGACRGPARAAPPCRALGLRAGRDVPGLGCVPDGAGTRARSPRAPRDARPRPPRGAVGRRPRRREPGLESPAPGCPGAARRARAPAGAAQHTDHRTRGDFPRCGAPFPRPGRVLRPGRAAGPPRAPGSER